MYMQVLGRFGRVFLSALSSREVEAGPRSALLCHPDHVSAFSCARWGCKRVMGLGESG